MLGLSVDNQTTRKAGFQKSFKFASQLSGRFFVSGVSGSLNKHTRSLLHEIKKENEAKKKYINAPEVVQKAQQDLNKDAILLLELEERLAKVCISIMHYIMIDILL